MTPVTDGMPVLQKEIKCETLFVNDLPAQTGSVGLPLTRNETALFCLVMVQFAALLLVLLRPRQLFKKGTSV